MGDKKLHALVWFLLTGTFLSRLALFITLPFISIYMTTKLGASPSVAGIVAGLGPLCGIFSAFLMGYISDRVGRKDILKISLLIWSFAFLGFSFSTMIWQFALFNMIYGMSRSAFESVATALMTDLTPVEFRKKVFHYRYFAINLGACIAPPIGAWLFVTQPKISFLITSLVYFVYFLLLTYFLYKWHPNKKQDALAAKPIALGSVIKILASDKPLLLFLLGNILMLLGFSQIETNLPMVLQSLYGMHGIKLFSYISLTNAITIVIIQFPLNNWVKKLNIIHVITIGFILYGIGTALFGVFLNMDLMLCLAMFIFSVGEILVFSNTYLLIDQIGPSHLKGSYFGITEICTLGFVVGPFLGGLFVQNNQAQLMFIVMGGLSLLSISVYLAGNQLLKRQSASI